MKMIRGNQIGNRNPAEEWQHFETILDKVEYAERYCKRFEEDYRDWIRLMSRDAACRLSALPPQEQKSILSAYGDFKEPVKVYREQFPAPLIMP